MRSVHRLQVLLCSSIATHNSYNDLQLYEKVEKVPAAAEKSNISTSNYAKDMQGASPFARKTSNSLQHSRLIVRSAGLKGYP